MQIALPNNSLRDFFMFLITGSRNSTDTEQALKRSKNSVGFIKKLSRNKFLFLPANSNSRIMTLGLYINELLYEHNCVVVPELGGFITRRVPAQINPVSNKITPPGKKLAFNQGLNLNDGLLAKYVATREEIAYEKALDKIQSLIVELRQTLFEHRTVHLERVGTFYIDQDEVMTFHPEFDINVSKEDYGLVTIAAVPVQRSAEDKVKQKIRARIDGVKPITKQPRRAVIGRRSITAMAATVLLAIIMFAGQQLNWPSQLNLSSISIGDFEWPWNENKPVMADEVTTIKYQVSPQLVSSIKQIADATVSDSTYLLLAKSFNNIDEASVFISDLKQQGVVDAKFSIREQSNTWVSAASYPNRVEAEKHLKEVQAVYADAKILVKRK
jgi:hypothetical protein